MVSIILGLFLLVPNARSQGDSCGQEFPLPIVPKEEITPVQNIVLQIQEPRYLFSNLSPLEVEEEIKSEFETCPENGNVIRKEIQTISIVGFLNRKGLCRLLAGRQKQEGERILDGISFPVNYERNFLVTDQGLFFVRSNAINQKQYTLKGIGEMYPRHSKAQAERIYKVLTSDYHQTYINTFLIFPLRYPVAAKEGTLKLASGHIVEFEPSTARIRNIQGCDSKVNPNIQLEGNGGLEIKSCQNSVVIDVDPRVGQMIANHRPNPKSKRIITGHSSIRDPNGGSCRIPNSKLFGIQNNTDAEIFHLFKNSSELHAILIAHSKECAQLDLSPLLNP